MYNVVRSNKYSTNYGQYQRITELWLHAELVYIVGRRRIDGKYLLHILGVFSEVPD
jgi:hypothetical protein